MFGSIWYYSLNQPPLTPPAAVFPVVWTILYTMIFVSLVLFITTRTGKSKFFGYIWFWGQLILNFIWTPIFFGLHKISAALIVLLVMDVLVLFNIKEFYEISKKSAYFLIPYFLWILFATYLNLGYVLLNR